MNIKHSQTENYHDLANDLKWSKRAITFDEKKYDHFRHMQKKLISLINPAKNVNFLDIGCGTGWAVCYVEELLKGEGNFIGVDISEGMIDKARKKAEFLKNISFYKTSAEEIPLESDYFEIIICTNSFHHYSNPEKAMLEIYRLLKPAGKIYILDITTDDFLVKWINKRVSRREKEHVKFYSTHEYKEMFKKAGLQYLKSKMIWHYPLKVHIAKK